MARPERNTVDYFPFYCDEGNKMFYLEEVYGNDGFATFVKILRELAKSEYHFLNLSKKTTLMFLSAKCKVTEENLNKIIETLIELEKFDKALWIESKIIWCPDFIESIKDAYKRRNNKCITYQGLCLHLISLGVISKGFGSKKEDKKPQTIVEYSKVKKTIEERMAEFKNSLQPFLEEFGSNILNEFYLYWTEKKPKGRKMKFEMQQTFDISRRLHRWRNNNFGNKEKSSAKKETINRQSQEVIENNASDWLPPTK